MYCPTCNIDVDEGEENCPKCGNYLSVNESPENAEPEVENIFLQEGADTSAKKETSIKETSSKGRKN